MPVLRVLLCLAVLLAVQPARAQQQEGLRVTEPVSDWAGAIDPETRGRLEGYLWELKQKTGVELAVATVDTTGGMPIEAYALQLAERSGLGQKGKDNGCLVLVAIEDRAYRIEVGYGLEGVLPDGYVGDVGREYFVPYFRTGQYAKGIEQGVVAIAQKIAADRGVTLQGVPEAVGYQPANDGPVWAWVLILLVMGLFGYLILRAALTRPRYRPMGTGYLGGGLGRGLGGGGGFGGFGGGGGRFGGGGASGRW